VENQNAVARRRPGSRGWRSIISIILAKTIDFHLQSGSGIILPAVSAAHHHRRDRSAGTADITAIRHRE
jgi:hypothetical protein